MHPVFRDVMRSHITTVRRERLRRVSFCGNAQVDAIFAGERFKGSERLKGGDLKGAGRVLSICEERGGVAAEAVFEGDGGGVAELGAGEGEVGPGAFNVARLRGEVADVGAFA